MNTEQFSTIEIEELNKIDKTLSGIVNFPISLERNIDKWKKVVDEIEKGYDDYIYEYLNDLYVRNLLQEYIDCGYSSISEKVLVIVKPIDDKFIENTKEVSKTLYEGKNDFWWMRIPKILTDKLKIDIKE